jgi:hypothetical protein
MMNLQPKLSPHDRCDVKVKGNQVTIFVRRTVGTVLFANDVERAFPTIQAVAQDAAQRVASLFRKALPEGIEIQTCCPTEYCWQPVLVAPHGNYFHGHPIHARCAWQVRLLLDWQTPANDPRRMALRAFDIQARAGLIISALTNNSNTVVTFGPGINAPKIKGRPFANPFNSEPLPELT